MGVDPPPKGHRSVSKRKRCNLKRSLPCKTSEFPFTPIVRSDEDPHQRRRDLVRDRTVEIMIREPDEQNDTARKAVAKVLRLLKLPEKPLKLRRVALTEEPLLEVEVLIELYDVAR